MSSNAPYPAELMAITEVSDALWSDDARVALSARQVGAVIDILRVASDHGLHKRRRDDCLICESYEKLYKATRDANGV